MYASRAAIALASLCKDVCEPSLLAVTIGTKTTWTGLNCPYGSWRLYVNCKLVQCRELQVGCSDCVSITNHVSSAGPL